MPQWFVPCFLAMWVGICVLLSLISGWFQLSRHFPARDHVEGKIFRVASGTIGYLLPVSYSNCLLATVNDTGIKLGIFLPFRILHPTLFIPWPAVDSVQLGRFLLMKRCVIKIRGFRLRILLYGGLGQAVFDTFNHINHRSM